jgi:nucleoside-diphosphate-sugar epimerase
MQARRTDDIWRINVEGSDRLLRSATRNGVERILVLSSMSAYDGTRQRYGRAKLDIEQLTLAVGGVAIRPGLVYGARPGGMAGTLTALTALPLTPVLSGGARQFPVLEDEFVQVVVDTLNAPTWRSEVFGVAQPGSVSFRQLLGAMAVSQGRRCRMVPVPWRLAQAVIVLAERLIPSFPLRSDSVRGLVRPAPDVPVSAAFPGLLDSLTRLEDWSLRPMQGAAA